MINDKFFPSSSDPPPFSDPKIFAHLPLKREEKKAFVMQTDNEKLLFIDVKMVPRFWNFRNIVKKICVNKEKLLSTCQKLFFTPLCVLSFPPRKKEDDFEE